ncbi:hypothetical protein CMV_014625 [Castanea mollissima]|uniref:Glycosyltransferase N-terminal domain-containing protein n=1 Tax=Castanea mollissima TaxID=60419 RepID=A0A8J4VKU9_9ROSI|nr:hypothetical protein CMV_014625 [Castanea mollissima]
MASQSQPLHFILFPLMAQGHMIPMIDIAKLLAQRGVSVTVITTTHNAARFETSLARAVESGLQIQVISLQFPCEEAGIPEGCDNLDKLPSLELGTKFFSSTSMLQQPVEELFEKLAPRPSCIISDMTLAWTADIALKFHIPRISFIGVCCFSLLCWHNLRVHKVHERISSESEYLVVPGLPDLVEFTKSQLSFSRDSRMEELCEQTVATDLASYGVIVNSFEELEPAYVKEYKKAREDKVWCIGPVSLCNKDHLDKAERVGGFLTHCSWNSIIEAICAGVPMLTWPLFADQFLNEKLVVHILKIAVSVGVEDPVLWGEEEKIGVLVKKEDVVGAIDRLMDEGEETEERRKRARELGEMAKSSVDDGGSSQLNLTLLIQDICNNGEST